MSSDPRQPRSRQLAYWLLFALFCGLLTYVVYGRALALPFFFDDFVHYPFVEANTVARIWLETDELAYYRPFNFMIWRLTYELYQRHHPVVDHAINLLLHAANGFMVGWLASRLWLLRGDRFPVVTRVTGQEDWWRVFISATLFLLFPFSYQAVPWIGSLSHLTVSALILLSLLFFVQMRYTRNRVWGAASLLVALVAPFAHENGILIMPFAVLIDLTTPGLAQRWRYAAKTALVWSLPLLVYVPIWLSLPRLEGGGLFGNSLEGMAQNAAYFLQGAFFPLTSLGGWLHYGRGLHDMTVVGLLSGIGMVVAIVIQLTHRATLRSLLPWLWIVLASLPAVLFLVFDYVINGPRLLMVASIGIAWLWADVILLFARGGRRGSADRLVRVAVVALAAVLLIARSLDFLDERMRMHEILGGGFKQVVAAAAEANAAGREAVVVNFPSWLAPKQATFALGHEGVLFWPDYVPPEMLLAVHTGDLGDLSFVKVDGIRPELADYYYGLTGPTPDWSMIGAVPSQVLMTGYGTETLSLDAVGIVGDHREGTLDPLATFTTADGSGSAQLLQAEIVPVDGGLDVQTLWQARAMPPQGTLFVHVVDDQGNLVAQSDGDPLGGSYPFASWMENARVLDKRFIPLEGVPAAGVRLGVYDRISGQRLVASGQEGAPLPENALPLGFTVP